MGEYKFRRILGGAGRGKSRIWIICVDLTAHLLDEAATYIQYVQYRAFRTGYTPGFWCFEQLDNVEALMVAKFNSKSCL
jgi:hypothetical protein